MLRIVRPHLHATDDVAISSTKLNPGDEIIVDFPGDGNLGSPEGPVAGRVDFGDGTYILVKLYNGEIAHLDHEGKVRLSYFNMDGKVCLDDSNVGVAYQMNGGKLPISDRRTPCSRLFSTAVLVKMDKIPVDKLASVFQASAAKLAADAAGTVEAAAR